MAALNAAECKNSADVMVHQTEHLDLKGKRSEICIVPHHENLAAEVLWYGSYSFYTANTPYLPSSRKRSPDGATTN